MFEKEAEEYVMREDVITENDRVPFDNGYGFQTVSFEDEVKKAFKDGAEFGYNKANEWHYAKDGDLPKDTTALYSVLVYSWDFGFSHLYKRYGTYIPTVCEWNGEYFKALDRDAYTNARNIKNCYAWKEIVLPKETKEK